MPAPEYRSWQLFNLIEPWGFEDREYRTGVILAMLHNVNAPKGKAKKPATFMRDMYKLIRKEIANIKQKEESRDRMERDVENMTEEERREHYIQVVKQTFGGAVIDKRNKR